MNRRIAAFATAAVISLAAAVGVGATPASADEPAPPTVTLTSPYNGLAYDNPASVLVRATASASVGAIAEVEFYENDKLIGTDTTAPYELRLTITVDGTYTYQAVAYDDGGRAEKSNTRTITVSTPPTITVAGTVVAGVEMGCKILSADFGQQFLLIGGDPAVVKVGARLVVTGKLRRDIASFCMQGRPLEVVTARPI